MNEFASKMAGLISVDVVMQACLVPALVNSNKGFLAL